MRVPVLFFVLQTLSFSCSSQSENNEKERMDLQNIIEIKLDLADSASGKIVKLDLINVSSEKQLINAAFRLSGDIVVVLNKEQKMILPDRIYKLRNITDEDFIILEVHEIKEIYFSLKEIYHDLEKGEYTIQVIYYNYENHRKGNLEAVVGKAVSNIVTVTIEQ